MIKKTLIGMVVVVTMLLMFLCWNVSTQVLTVNYQSNETQIANLNKDWEGGYDGFISKMGKPERFEVESNDDVKIAGYYFKNVDSIECGVILSHGFTSGKTAMLKYGDMFWDCGCDLVVYDHRGHGESDKVDPTGGIREKDDHVIITQWYKERTGLEDSQIGWMGASWGAATVLLAGAYENEMAFIVADSPFEDWYTAIYERGRRQYGAVVDGLSPIAMFFVNMRAGIQHRNASPILAAPKVTEPIFLIHSQSDEATSSMQSVNISKHLHDNCQFVHTQWGAGHCRDINTRPEEYRQLVHAFIKDKVGGFGRCK